ncbi:hypothetical protein RND81_14G213600 [Saponaria officinalis]|uniref:Retrovirus-related Pol polyprotein from transposon TNT 1-94-like beta-barrel domain-containing protein n=1 Tax=Saponaria officinalis TaxID=3572 RepID=A0AAW1GS38_SAPOF
MGMNPTCSCTCTCGSKTKQLKFLENQKIVQFLMGLNDTYTVIRGTILMQNPLPKLSLVYNNLLQEERQREIHNSTQFQINSASFYARNNRSRPPYGVNSFSHNQRVPPTPVSRKPISTVSNEFNTLECRYCKKLGHTIDKCFRLQNRNKKFAGNVHFGDGILGNPGAVQNDAAQVPDAANFAGNSFSSVTPDFLYNSWIIDSGATDHMCSNKSLFSIMTPIPKPYSISLPTGQVVIIDSVGIVPVSADITLHDVLFVPCFKFNLLSVAKLVKQLDLHVCFTSDTCFLQGSSLKKPLILGRNHKDLFLLHSAKPQSRLPYASKDTAVDSVSSSVVTSINSVVWHNRLGHLPLYKLKVLNVCMNIIIMTFNSATEFLKGVGILHQTSCVHTPQ